MFVLTTIADTMRIPPSMFAQPTIEAIEKEIDAKYPNRVIYDVGLVICRYNDSLEVGEGICVAGDGGAHHEVVFQLVVFRPFVDEVCIGTIIASNEQGLQVSLGFFDEIFIPAYWMLRPSHYEPNTGLWVWVPPDYDAEQQQDENHSSEMSGEPQDNESGFEMELGSSIRFKVKALEFTQVTNTVKGVQATTTTTSKYYGGANSNKTSPPDMHHSSNTNDDNPGPVRKRSSSVDLTNNDKTPACFYIVASICEDGLGLLSWWSPVKDDEEELDCK